MATATTAQQLVLSRQAWSTLQAQHTWTTFVYVLHYSVYKPHWRPCKPHRCVQGESSPSIPYCYNVPRMHILRGHQAIAEMNALKILLVLHHQVSRSQNEVESQQFVESGAEGIFKQACCCRSMTHPFNSGHFQLFCFSPRREKANRWRCRCGERRQRERCHVAFRMSPETEVQPLNVPLETASFVSRCQRGDSWCGRCCPPPLVFNCQLSPHPPHPTVPPTAPPHYPIHTLQIAGSLSPK